MNRNYDVIVLFQNTLILRRPGVAILADIIKITTMFIKAIFKRILKNLKRITKMQSLFVFLDIAKLADFWRKSADVSRKQGCVT